MQQQEKETLELLLSVKHVVDEEVKPRLSRGAQVYKSLLSILEKFHFLFAYHVSTLGEQKDDANPVEVLVSTTFGEKKSRIHFSLIFLTSQAAIHIQCTFEKTLPRK